MPLTPGDIVTFWSEIGPEKWYAVDPALDATIRTRYLETWVNAARGDYRDWLSSPRGALGYLILTDQFPRNMFRDESRAFATDRLARSAAMIATQRDWDLMLPEPIRQFFYLPFMHAETVPDQDRGVCLILARMPETGRDNLLHARAHREVIRRFGRFPHRNAALGRSTTPEEAAFLEGGGYGAVVQRLSAAHAA
jgi:uncharacterized protein (DUF924 family)